MPTGRGVGQAAQATGVGQPVDPEELQSQYMREEAGPFMHGLNNVPGGTALFGAMVGRATNTITGGGWSPNTSTPFNTQKITGFIGEGARQRFGSIKGNVRYANQDIFHGTGAQQKIGRGGASTASRAYTPFMASGAANAAGRMISGDAHNFSGTSQKIAGSRFGQAAKRSGLVQEGGEVTSRGFISRVAAGARTANMSESAFARKGSNIQNFLKGGYSGADAIGDFSSKRAVSGAAGVPGGRVASAQSLMMSGPGTITGRMGGYMAGTVKGATGREMSTAARPFANQGAQQAFGRARADVAKLGLENRANWGVGSAARGAVQSKSAGGLKAGAKLIGSRGIQAASRLAGPVGAGLMAYDVTKGFFEITGAITRDLTNFASEANSDPGMRGRMLEGEFQDNRASLSSRQRGVMAIQNSRLNSRSVLGSEAGRVASHFG